MSNTLESGYILVRSEPRQTRSNLGTCWCVPHHVKRTQLWVCVDTFITSNALNSGYVWVCSSPRQTHSTLDLSWCVHHHVKRTQFWVRVGAFLTMSNALNSGSVLVRSSPTQIFPTKWNTNHNLIPSPKTEETEGCFKSRVASTV